MNRYLVSTETDPIKLRQAEDQIFKENFILLYALICLGEKMINKTKQISCKIQTHLKQHHR